MFNHRWGAKESRKVIAKRGSKETENTQSSGTALIHAEEEGTPHKHSSRRRHSGVKTLTGGLDLTGLKRGPGRRRRLYYKINRKSQIKLRQIENRCNR